jgi:hypothetical protein
MPIVAMRANKKATEAAFEGRGVPNPREETIRRITESGPIRCDVKHTAPSISAEL